MLNVPVEIQELIKTDGVKKNFRVHFPNGERADLTNENIVSESVSFTESVCSADTFRFGLAEASEIQFEMVGIENIIGKTIECSMEFAVPANMQVTYGEWYSVPYGKFVVESCPRNHEDMTHRKVTAYSLLKYMFEVSNFLQKRILPVPAVHVSMNAISAYVTGNTSAFTEGDANLYEATGLGTNYALYDSSNIPYFVSVYNNTSGIGYGVKRFLVRNIVDAGYKVSYVESGETKGSDIGQSVINWLDDNDLELLYDGNGNKIFDSNEEAIKFVCGYFWNPIITEVTTDNSGYGIYYNPFSAELDKFIPTVRDDAFAYSERSLATYVYCLNEQITSVTINKWSSVNIWSDSVTASTIAAIPVSGFTSESTCLTYSDFGIVNKASVVAIDATLAVNTLAYNRRVSNRQKNFYQTMFAYSNAYSNRDLMDGWAELNGAFIHSERDGTISMESLDNTNPYALTGADVVERAWWDEYDVNPIGTVLYTFFNPFTGEIASDSYQFGEGKSVYDLTGNKALEAMDFTVKKAKTVSAMSDKNIFYRYTGSETGRTKDDFYYWDYSQPDGGAWVSGGHYSTIRSVVEFVLDQVFIPHIQAVNFTPLEMDMRALPFLEAGDAITLTLKDGTTVSSYILNHTINGVQLLQDTIESVSGDVL